MRVCGIALSSQDATLVVIDVNNDASFSLVDASDVSKISLGDHRDPDLLRGFQRTLDSFLRDKGVDKVFLRECTYKGKYASGPASLKMEALIQCLERDVETVSPQGIKARFKKHETERPDTLYAYQQDAFETALYAIEP